ncbi:MAG: RluA family pseudouridine synthase [Myxococcota bacterium]
MAPRSRPAERHDPPLVARRFTLDAALPLDAFRGELRGRLAGSGASAERALWHGGVHVNGHPLDVDALPACLPAGAWVVVYAFVREPEPVSFEPSRILHDADGLVAVDKPPWLPMQRTRASARLSLEAELRRLVGDDSLVAVHRLDRQTSGVALFARGRAGAWATRALAARQVRKCYLAVTAPEPARDAFACEGWIARAPDPARFRYALHAEAREGGRWSRTTFAVRARAGGRALVEAAPETGRTHQLRVHLAANGTPIAGDEVYGAGCLPGAERVLLHAASLGLEGPGGAPLSFEAALPRDLESALRVRPRAV